MFRLSFKGLLHVFIYSFDHHNCVKPHQGETTTCVSLSTLVLPGENCQVPDSRSGYVFDLSSLKGKDYQVRHDKYIYHLSVCGGLQSKICSHREDTVASCQVDQNKEKIGGTELGKKN